MSSGVESLMSGAIDLHVHATFEGKPRRQTMVEVAKDAVQAGMRAAVFKCKDSCTAGEARLVSSLVEGFEAYGGVVLDYSVGGLNPFAVQSCLNMGGKIIWMPSFDSAWTIKKAAEGTGGAKIYQKLLDPKRKVAGLSVFKGGLGGSELLPEVRDILAQVAESGAILDTSHLSPRESIVLAKEAKKAGVEKILITQANSDLTNPTIEEQKELARAGAYLMYTFAQCLPSPWREGQPLQTVMNMIREVGPDHCVLSTDLGMLYFPPPVEGLRMFVAGLLTGGVKDQDLERMVRINPAYLLGLG